MAMDLEVLQLHSLSETDLINTLDTEHNFPVHVLDRITCSHSYNTYSESESSRNLFFQELFCDDLSVK